MFQLNAFNSVKIWRQPETIGATDEKFSIFFFGHQHEWRLSQITRDSRADTLSQGPWRTLYAAAVECTRFRRQYWPSWHAKKGGMDWQYPEPGLPPSKSELLILIEEYSMAFDTRYIQFNIRFWFEVISRSIEKQITLDAHFGKRSNNIRHQDGKVLWLRR